MALARSDKLGVVSSSSYGSSSYVTSSFTPDNNSLMAVCIAIMNDNNATDSTASLTVSGGGWTYTPQVAVSNTSGYACATAIYTASITTGASMTLTVDCTPTVYRWAVTAVCYSGFDSGSPAGGEGTAAGGSAPSSVTLSPAPASTSETLVIANADTTNTSYTPTSGTKLYELGALGTDMTAAVMVYTGTAANKAWTGGGSGAGGSAVGLEIKESGVVLQYMRPDGDVTATGWQNQAAGTTNLYQSIDETSADDADYVTETI